MSERIYFGKRTVPKKRRKKGERKKVTRPQKKGKAAELEVCKLIESILGGKAVRTPQSGAWEIKGDIWNRGNLLASWLVEVKRQEKWSVPAWIRKAREQCGRQEWVLVMRRSNEDWVACVELRALLNLMAMVQGESDAEQG